MRPGGAGGEERMSLSQFPAPADLVRHRGDALLLDEITCGDDKHLEARVVVRPGTAYSDYAGHLPAWAGPEIMAQAISAFSGLRLLRARGQSAPIGLLLGIRSYRCVVGEFRCGETLLVEVAESSEDEDGMAVFDCRICRAGDVVASGRLTVFQPADDSFLERECARNA
jgi:predicted hotdog family 3-hydroxylacyl-ACP dehydratase